MRCLLAKCTHFYFSANLFKVKTFIQKRAERTLGELYELPQPEHTRVSPVRKQNIMGVAEARWGQLS